MGISDYKQTVYVYVRMTSSMTQKAFTEHRRRQTTLSYKLCILPVISFCSSGTLVGANIIGTLPK